MKIRWLTPEQEVQVREYKRRGYTMILIDKRDGTMIPGYDHYLIEYVLTDLERKSQ